MQVAFYAPLKPIDHPVPSGDRLIARMLCEAMQAACMNVDIAARLRSRVADGNILRQAQLAELGTKLAGRLLRQYKSGVRPKPDVWFTYHLYYKAPDWIGPVVASALDIPYVVAEASFAPKRATGPWAQSHKAVETALRAADAVFSLNRVDMECLADVCAKDRLHFLPPFTRISDWMVTNRKEVKSDCVRLVTTAMMRDGDKLKSYGLLAESLERLTHRGIDNWHLTVIGDGPARQKVEKLFQAHGIRGSAVSFAGLTLPEQTKDILASSDLFVWPAINEAFGMALLEAQAAGLPVLAGDTGGVSGIVSPGVTGWLVPVGDVDAFTDRLSHCVQSDVDMLRGIGHAAASKTKQHHTVEAAAKVLSGTLGKLVADYGQAPDAQDRGVHE